MRNSFLICISFLCLFFGSITAAPKPIGKYVKVKANNRGGAFENLNFIKEITFGDKMCRVLYMGTTLSGKHLIDGNYVYIEIGGELGTLAMEIIDNETLEGEGWITGTFKKESALSSFKLEEKEGQSHFVEKSARKEEVERHRMLEEERRKREEQDLQERTARDAISQAFRTTNQSQRETAETNAQEQLSKDSSISRERKQSGLSFGLSERNLLGSLPRPEYNIDEEGIVIVEITVNRYGVVTKAEPLLRGTTTNNTDLLRAACEAALKARFNKNSDAPSSQKGTITYHFKIN